MNKNLDIKGIKFGRLTPIRYLGNNKNHVQIWECECECGKHIQTLRASLLQGNTRSCGCLNDESRHKKRTQDNCVCPTCGTSFRVKPSRLKMKMAKTILFSMQDHILVLWVIHYQIQIGTRLYGL